MERNALVNVMTIFFHIFMSDKKVRFSFFETCHCLRSLLYMAFRFIVLTEKLELKNNKATGISDDYFEIVTRILMKSDPRKIYRWREFDMIFHIADSGANVNCQGQTVQALPTVLEIDIKTC